MPDWLIALIGDIDAALAADHLSAEVVGYARKRRMAYDARWPARRQMEAHADAAAGDTAKRDLMMSEFDAIKAAFPK